MCCKILIVKITLNSGRFVDFCSAHHLVIGGTIFQHRACDKVTWQHPSGQGMYEIDHLAISQRFRGCLEDVRNKKAADSETLRDNYVVVAKMRLRTA